MLVNFDASYSAAQINAGTLLAPALLSQYGSLIQGTTITMYTPQELSGIDADQLHKDILSVLGDLEMYLSHPYNLIWEIYVQFVEKIPYLTVTTGTS